MTTSLRPISPLSKLTRPRHLRVDGRLFRLAARFPRFLELLRLIIADISLNTNSRHKRVDSRVSCLTPLIKLKGGKFSELRYRRGSRS